MLVPLERPNFNVRFAVDENATLNDVSKVLKNAKEAVAYLNSFIKSFEKGAEALKQGKFREAQLTIQYTYDMPKTVQKLVQAMDAMQIKKDIDSLVMEQTKR